MNISEEGRKHFESVQDRVALLRKRLRRLDMLRSVASGVLVLVPLSVVLLSLDWWIRPGKGGRLVMLAILVACLCEGFRRFVWPALGRRRSLAGVAMLVEERFPELDARLVSTVQLGSERIGDTELISQLFSETESATARIPLESLADWRPFRSLLLGGLLMALAAGVLVVFNASSVNVWLQRTFAPWTNVDWPTRTRVVIDDYPPMVRRGDGITLTGHLTGQIAATGQLFARDASGGRWRKRAFDIENDGRFAAEWESALDDLEIYCAAGDGKSNSVRIEAITPPQVSSVSAEVTFRSYTGLLPESIEGGDIEALEGSTVTLRLGVTRPVDRGEIRLRGGGVVPVEVVDATTCQAVLEVRNDDRYEVWLYDVHGFTSDTPAAWEIRAIADSVPSVLLRKPEGERRVTPLSLIDVEVEGHDDFGVREANLRWEIEGQKKSGKTRMPVRTDQKDVRSSIVWDLSPLGLQPTDRVRFWVEMKDEGPYREEGEVGQSAAGLLNVMSPEDLRRMVDERIDGYYEQLEDIERQLERSRDAISQSAAKLIGDTETGDIVESLRAEEWRNVETSRRLETIGKGLKEASEDLTASRLAEEDEAANLNAVGDNVIALSSENLQTILNNLRDVRQGLSDGQ